MEVSDYLIGHKNSVLCLKLESENSSIIASGSEDSTVRLWDLRILKSTRCLHAFKNNPISSISFSQSNNNHIYVASNQKVFFFDLRRPDVILRSEDRIIFEGKEEINSIDNFSELIGICDDEGNVIVINEKTFEKKVKMPKIHLNVCSSIVFGGKNEIFSGGLDSRVVQWNVITGKKQKEWGFTPQESSAMICNPPFVHFICLSKDKEYIYCCLGDGRLVILNKNKDSPILSFQPHNSAVSQVCFVSESSNSSDNTKSFRIITSSNDSTLALWEINHENSNKNSNENKSKNNTKNNKKVTQNNKVQFQSPKELSRISLINKPNWIESLNNSKIAFADTSDIISIVNIK